MKIIVSFLDEDDDLIVSYEHDLTLGGLVWAEIPRQAFKVEVREAPLGAHKIIPVADADWPSELARKCHTCGRPVIWDGVYEGEWQHQDAS